jgi:hypothetical protein
MISQIKTEGQSHGFANGEEIPVWRFSLAPDLPLPYRGFVARMRAHSCSCIVDCAAKWSWAQMIFLKFNNSAPRKTKPNPILLIALVRGGGVFEV